MKRVCYVCKKEYETDKEVTYLCPECKAKANELPKDDESKLKLLAHCEDLGIISIIV